MSGLLGRHGALTTAFLYVFSLCLVLCCFDAVAAQEVTCSYLFSSFMILLIILTPAIPVVGIALLAVAGRQDIFELLLDRGRAAIDYLTGRNAERGFVFGARLVTTGLWLAGASLVSVIVGTKVAFDVVRPNFQSILTVGATLAALAVFWTVKWILDRGAIRAAPGMASLRWISWLWSRPLIPAVLALMAASAAGAVVVVRFWEPISLSPWQTPAMLAGLAMASVGLTFGLSRAVRTAIGAWIMAVLVVVVVGVGLIATASLETNDRSARRYFAQAPSTGLAYSALSSILDRDDDGFMHAFAGGDCEPDNSKVSPAALDFPGNGMDEDCDGRDVSPESMVAGKHDYDVPEDFSAEGMNVIIVSVDALSARHLGFMGYDRDTSPGLDELSENCVVFDKAFAQGPSTRLSIASMFTSQYDSQIQYGTSTTIPFPLTADNLTMAEIFRDNGYDTVAIIPNSYFTQRWKSILQGFDTVDSSSFGKGIGKHNSAKVTKAATRELGKKRKRPLFMWVHYWDTHPPFYLPKGYEGFGKADRTDIYDSEVSYVDDNMAELWPVIDRKMKKRGYILIVTADHGSALDPQHTKHTHGHDLHSGVLHVPLLVCASRGVEPRRIADTPVSLIDLLPTLVNLTGIDVGDAAFEGNSLVPFIFGEGEDSDRMIFHQYFLMERARKGKDPLMMVAARNRDYNFIWNREDDTYQLFNYTVDPDESDDLFVDEAYIGDNFVSFMHNWLIRVHVINKPHDAEYEESDEEYVDEGGSEDDYANEY